MPENGTSLRQRQFGEIAGPAVVAVIQMAAYADYVFTVAAEAWAWWKQGLAVIGTYHVGKALLGGIWHTDNKKTHFKCDTCHKPGEKGARSRMESGTQLKPPLIIPGKPHLPNHPDYDTEFKADEYFQSHGQTVWCVDYVGSDSSQSCKNVLGMNNEVMNAHDIEHVKTPITIPVE